MTLLADMRRNTAGNSFPVFESLVAQRDAAQESAAC